MPSVLSSNFDERWKQSYERYLQQQNGILEPTLDRIILGLIIEFLERYAADFASKGVNEPKAGTPEEEQHIEKVMNNLSDFWIRLENIVGQISGLGEAWRPVIKALVKLKNSRRLINATTYARNYSRVFSHKRTPAGDLREYDRSFTLMQNALRELSREVERTSRVVGGR